MKYLFFNLNLKKTSTLEEVVEKMTEKFKFDEIKEKYNINYFYEYNQDELKSLVMSAVLSKSFNGMIIVMEIID